MKDIFIVRYGQPSERGKKMVQSRMGAQFENEILDWYGESQHHA